MCATLSNPHGRHVRLIGDVGATTASAVNHVVPIAAVLVGAPFLGQAVTSNVVVGGITVLHGMAHADNRLPAMHRPRSQSVPSRSRPRG